MKVKSILLCLCLFAGINASAQFVLIRGLYYNLSGNEATITGAIDGNCTSNEDNSDRLLKNVSNYGLFPGLIVEMIATEFEVPHIFSGGVILPKTVTYRGKTYRVTGIGKKAFSGWSGLSSIVIPKSVTTIGVDAFKGCYSLKAVHIKDLAAWCNISFMDNPIYTAKHLYLNGKEIKRLVIPDGVTNVNKGAFRNCSKLKSVSIPDGMASIGDYVFYGCSALKNIYCHAETPPCAEDNSFSDRQHGRSTLHVPANSVNSYINTSP